MKRFEWIKTLQLLLYFILTVAGLVVVFGDEALYQTIASDPHVKLLCGILWLMMGLSYVFMFVDFASYADFRRENLALDQAIYSDMLTGVANRYSCDAYIAQYRNRELPENMGCITLDLINMSEINSRWGRERGDGMIREFSDILMEASTKSGDGEEYSNVFIGRNGGNKFLAIFRSCSQELFMDFLRELGRLEEKREMDGKLKLEYAVGTALHKTDAARGLPELVALSDRRAAMDAARKRR